MIKRGVSDQTPKDPVKETKLTIMAVINYRDNMSCMGTITAITITNGTTIEIGTIALDFMFHLKTGNLPLGMLEVT